MEKLPKAFRQIKIMLTLVFLLCCVKGLALTSPNADGMTTNVTSAAAEIFPGVKIPVPLGYEVPSAPLAKRLIVAEMMEISQFGDANAFYGIVANKLRFVRKNRTDDCFSSISVKCLASNAGGRSQGRFEKKQVESTALLVSHLLTSAMRPGHSHLLTGSIDETDSATGGDGERKVVCLRHSKADISSGYALSQFRDPLFGSVVVTGGKDCWGKNRKGALVLSYKWMLIDGRAFMLLYNGHYDKPKGQPQGDSAADWGFAVIDQERFLESWCNQIEQCSSEVAKAGENDGGLFERLPKGKSGVASNVEIASTVKANAKAHSQESRSNGVVNGGRMQSVKTVCGEAPTTEACSKADALASDVLKSFYGKVKAGGSLSETEYLAVEQSYKRACDELTRKSYAELNSAKPNHSNVVAIKNQRRMLKMWHDACVKKRTVPFDFDKNVVRNDDGSMTFKKIPAGGEKEMLHMAMTAKLKEMPKVTRDVRLPFLFPPAGEGIAGALLDYVDEKENFRLKLPVGFSRSPERKTISEWTHGCGFQGRNENEWAYVEHMIVSVDHLNERLEGWVASAVMLTGKPLIHPHAEACRTYDLVRFSRVPAICSQWMKSHCADEMTSWIGTIGRGGTTCRLFIVCLKRGRECWMVEYVFPVVGSAVVKDAVSPSHDEMIRASLVMGNFGICNATNSHVPDKNMGDVGN